MLTQTIRDSPKSRRGGGQLSHLLLAPGQFGSQHLAITLVEGAPGSRQSLRAHSDSEQVYVIVSGRGRMTVVGEERELEAGTLVFIPPGAEHAIYTRRRSSTSPPRRRPFVMPTGEFTYEPAEAR